MDTANEYKNEPHALAQRERESVCGGGGGGDGQEKPLASDLEAADRPVVGNIEQKLLFEPRKPARSLFRNASDVGVSHEMEQVENQAGVRSQDAECFARELLKFLVVPRPRPAHRFDHLRAGVLVHALHATRCTPRAQYTRRGIANWCW
jgi:hypothetical protein